MSVLAPPRDLLAATPVISCPVNDLLYEPSPRPRSLPSPKHGRGDGGIGRYIVTVYTDMILRGRGKQAALSWTHN